MLVLLLIRRAKKIPSLKLYFLDQKEGFLSIGAKTYEYRFE